MIVAWLLQIASMGFPITRGQLIQSIQLYLNKTNRNTKFTDNLPGRKWYDGFMQRHPIISQRTSQNLTASRAAITEKKLRDWHAEVHKYFEDNNLLPVLEDNTRIFNMDESAFYLSPKEDKVLTKKGS